MIFRFSLYGFLKNQRYFETFLVLAFMDKGLSFLAIGLLIALRELITNVLEVPSGALADVGGRRSCMIASFAAYVVSFVVLGLASSVGVLAVGMVLYGVGDAFRTGTHKAMIFAWLEEQGRLDERVRVYGYTRSWSKLGSAASVVVAAGVVVVSDGYDWVFFLTAVPYAAGIVNFLGYPRSLDGRGAGPTTAGAIWRHMVGTVREAATRPRVRRLVLESMGFDGVFGGTKDYLQPVLEGAAVALAASMLAGAAGGAEGAGAAGGLSDVQSTALLVGPVYFVLFVLAGVASRRAHSLVERAGGEEPAARRLWVIAAATFAALAAGGIADAAWAMIVAFVLLHIVHNLWRPVLIARFDAEGTGERGASLLSVESQGRRASTMLVAPLLGWAVDTVTAADGGAGGAYWPVGALGLIVALGFVVSAVGTVPNRGDSRRSR